MLHRPVQLKRRQAVSRRELRIVVLASFVLAMGLSARPALAQAGKSPYPNMAPVEQYLMDRDAEIAFARTAAPASISGDADVLVMTRKGYETAVKGKNGFVCLVERAWMASFDNAEYWNSKNRSPICFNPPGARTILPFVYMKTELALAGKSNVEIRDRLKDALAKKELPTPEPGAMCYMMSKNAYLTDGDGHNLAHLMFWVPAADRAALGADLPGSPIMLFNDDPEPIGGFIVATGMWSDGTPAPLM
jgi:hypothetical protein